MKRVGEGWMIDAVQERLTELSAGSIAVTVDSAEFRPGPRQEL